MIYSYFRPCWIETTMFIYQSYSDFGKTDSYKKTNPSSYTDSAWYFEDVVLEGTVGGSKKPLKL